MTLSPDGRLLASGDEQGTIILTDLASGQTRLRFIGHTAALKTLAFSPDGKLLASVAEDSVSSNRARGLDLGPRHRASTRQEWIPSSRRTSGA